MEELTKEQVMGLNGDQLAEYINNKLASGQSLSGLSEKIGFRRQTIRDRLKRDGYFYNKDCNAYLKPLFDEPLNIIKTPHKEKKKAPATITLEEVLERLEALEMRLNGIQNDKQQESKEFKPKIFESDVQPRNYPLHKEVIDLLSEVTKANPHLKVKDIVNHALFLGLSMSLHSDSIEN